MARLTFRYETRLGTREFEADTEHAFDHTFDVLCSVWKWKERRKRWDKIFPSLRSLAFGVPKDSGVKIVVADAPLPPLKPYEGRIYFRPNRYSFAGYSVSEEGPVLDMILAFDKFYLDRKTWKIKTKHHLDYLLAQEGYRLGN